MNVATPQPEDSSEPIFDSAEECEALFKEGTSRLEAASDGMVRNLQELEQRFAAWTGYSGVFAERIICLDYRLRHHPDLQDLVLRLLDILRTNLLQCETIWC